MSQLREPVAVRGLFVVAKYWADDDLRRATPYEVVPSQNMVLTAGANALWNRFAGLGAVTAFDAANGRLCVGNGTASAAAGQTDLQGSSKFRKVFDAAPTISGGAFMATATFTTADANFAWEEAGVANAGAGGVLFDRVVQSYGVKTSASQWVLSATLQA